MKSSPSIVQPDLIGQKVASHRLTIGLLSDEFAFDIPVAFLRGAEAGARDHDVNLVYIASSALRSAQDFRVQSNIFFDLINAHNVDALLLASNLLGVSTTFAELTTVCRRYQPIPMVSLGLAIDGIPSVIQDNAQGMYAEVSHLIEVHGYRRIAYIGGPPEHPDAQERQHAYLRALADHDLPIDPTVIALGDFQTPSGITAVRVLLDERRKRLGRDIEAIVTANDYMAWGVLQELQTRLVRVPDEVAVVGFDDIALMRILTPPLTTVHAPFDEIARQGVAILLACRAGESVPAVTVVPARAVIRQSCGCAAAHGCETEEMVLPADTILKIANDPSGAIWGLNQRIQDGRDVLIWEQALAALRQHAPALLATPPTPAAPPESVDKDLWAVLTRTAYLTFQDKQYDQIMQELGRALIATIDLADITNILATRLPQLGIRRCYLALYEEPPAFGYPQRAPEWSRLRLAYTEAGHQSLPAEGLRFPSRQLIPQDMLPQHERYTLIAEALYFQQEQIGFIVFDHGARDERIYPDVQAQISSALQGALLVQRVRENAAEIARQKYIVDTFLENVPDAIFFKDRDSRFIRVNKAHANRVGLSDPAEEIGKTDLDLFPKTEEARARYDEEQAIIRTGVPLLNVEEELVWPDGRVGWSLVTKMPLRDEHGTIIGTFGISRDITELKKAQQALAQAYSEISVLNVQLQEENVRMSAELNVVKQLQRMVLPRPQELANIPGLDIVGYMQPADEVGGDYYDVLHHDGVVHIGIGDVTGHGLESGVVMLMTQAAIRTLIEHGETDPVKFVTTLNRLIYKNVERMGADKNLTFALVQCQNGQFKLVGQHEEFLVVRQGGQVERMSTMDLGFPVSLEPEIADWVHAATVTLAPGDGLVLYTDGITEAENAAKQQYGLDRLCAMISTHWEHSAEAIKQAVVDDVMAHIGMHTVHDDLTLVVLKQQ